MTLSTLETQQDNFDQNDTKAPLEPSIRGTKDDLGSVNKFYTKFPKDDQHYIEDLYNTPIIPSNKVQILVLTPSLTHIVYMHQALKNIIVTLMFEWTMPFFNPWNFLLLVTVFPTLIITIILLEVALKIGHKLGLRSAIQKIADEWGNGLSCINWCK